VSFSRSLQLFLCFISALFLNFDVASSSSPPASLKQKKTVVILVSFPILADLTRNLLPSQGYDVQSLLTGDADPHSYQARAQDFLRMKKADLIVAVGPSFDPWFETTHRGSKTKTPLILVEDLLPLQNKSSKKKLTAHHDHRTDPHFWQSASFTIDVLKELKLALQKHFPEDKGLIQQRWKHYVSQIEKVHHRVEEGLKGIPQSSRQILIPHQSFQYFAQTYSIQVYAVSDSGQSREASMKWILELMEKIKKNEIKSLFYEKSSPREIIQSLASRSHKTVAGTLYSDSFDSQAGVSNYLELIEHNSNLIIQSLKEALP
jgi:ABC-type Zn uptake system ZnuABC Zn-binding protein ZnuA